MSIEETTFEVPSTDGEHTLRGVVYLPSQKAKGYFHVVHGMTEHIDRYHSFMTEIAENGYICFGYDHLGHGRTADSDEELGFIAKKNGDELLARDVGAFSDAVFEKYGKGLPYFLMGHSMGSFVVRRACVTCVSPDGLIIMGTGGKNPAAVPALILIKIIRTVYGDKHISPLLNKLAFGSYNNRFGGGSEKDPKPWLTGDDSIRQAYYADKFCMFDFTITAMGDLIRIMKKVNDKPWYANFEKDLPTLIVSGTDDPVGNYGKGVREVEDGLVRAGCNAKCILYEGARHEILNDFTREKVIGDILDFINTGNLTKTN